MGDRTIRRVFFNILMLRIGCILASSQVFSEHTDDEALTSFDHMIKPIASILDETESSRKLAQFTKHEFFTPEMHHVGRNVHIALGYAVGNSIMIEGDDGIIIVDTTESPTSMAEIMNEFRKITTKPVRAIVFTHFHYDHHRGASHIFENQRKDFSDINIDVYAHEITRDVLGNQDFAFHSRSTRQFGPLLPKNPNQGPFARSRVQRGEDKIQQTLPTVTYTDKASFTVSGIDFELLHTPGETEDHTTVWLPNQRIVLTGDNMYKIFPNIYAIRGVIRNPKQWYQSLDIVMNLKAEYLIGSHNRPISGQKNVEETLIVYRDSMKYIHDQTLRLLNKGYYPGKIVEQVKLPENLSKHPYLQEHYGALDWTVRSIFNDYLGWFSGNPQDLHPINEGDRAARMVRLITYAQTQKVCAIEVMLREAEISHKNSYSHYLTTGKHLIAEDKWALELTDIILQLEDLEKSVINTAKKIKISALRALGVEEMSANGRNYYLSCALEIESNATGIRPKASRALAINKSHVSKILDLFCLKVDGLNCQHERFTVGLTFIDLGKKYRLRLRNSVCDVIDIVSNATTDVSMTMTSDVYKAILSEDKYLNEELQNGNIKIIEGSLAQYEKFLNCFDRFNYV